ncbi:UNVERIFIED_CONTAM: YTH domain-containing protein ECT2 [Sesamum radiatum]|uniref:YTH domain-containing family protein n=1 Tax=Sesamum radiatum TaxID=300843 RepID=A0AAW2W668_SESRA
MAAVAPPSDHLSLPGMMLFVCGVGLSIEAADLLQKLSLDSQAKTIEIPDATKKPAIDSNNVPNGIQSDRSVTPLLPDFMDPTMCYLPNGYPSTAYYYGGYDGTTNEWEDYTRYVNQDGVEMTPGVYGDNGSLMYHHGYGYAPYGPYSPATSPVPTVGHDGQLYGAQHYQYPTPYFQSLTPTSGPYPTPAAPAKGEIATSAAADQAPLSVDSTNTKSNGIANSGGAKGNNGTAPARAAYQNSSFNVNGSYGRGALPGAIHGSGYQDPRFGFDGLQSPIPWLESPYFSDGQPRPVTTSSMTSPATNGNGVPSTRNQNFRPHLMGTQSQRLQESKGFVPVALAVKGQNIPLSGATDNDEKKSTVTPDREQYNRPDFPETYADAKFFIIKSYSEDDVHKSIKYNVWASTLNGNKKLDAAYQDAQQRPGGCPVFLFFSVNTSGQFVGVAEMTGPVDFNKMWSTGSRTSGLVKLEQGLLLLKIFKDHTSKQCILDDFDFYEDRQKRIQEKKAKQQQFQKQVKLEQGLLLLNIFKDHTSKQCILDDFDFYEDRQKRIQEKKAKQQQFQKQAQVWEGKHTEEKNKESTSVDLKLEKSSETASHLNKEATPVVHPNRDSKTVESSKSGDILKTVKPAAVPEKKLVANGVANGC